MTNETMTDKILEILSIGKQLQGLAEALPATVTAWVELLDTLKRRKAAKDVDHVIAQINMRLFKRYVLIHQFRNIITVGDLPLDQFNQLTADLSERMDYLKKFDEEIPEMIAKIGNPGLAADIRNITTTSIQLYKKIVILEDRKEIVALAPRILPILEEIAEKLESTSDALNSYK